MSAWPYDRDAWEESLRATTFKRRAAALALAEVADESGFIARADIPRRGSVRGRVSTLTELGFVETVPHGLRLRMTCSPVTVRRAA